MVEGGNTIYDSRNNCNAIIKTKTNELVAGCKNTIIPNSVTSIDGAFQGCSGLTSVTIPNSVTSIGDWAFEGCSGLTSVTIPNSVTSIGEKAFYGCRGLTSFTIPNSVTSIGSSAFTNCIGLTSVTIPNSVTRIGSDAFSCCWNLSSVTIPNSVTSIGNYSFNGCSGLTSVTIPNSVTSIGEKAFQYCRGLTSITIPNSVTSIGNYAFNDCSGLTEVYSLIEEPFAINSKVFQNYYNGRYFYSATLYVPKGTKAKYEATDGWKELKEIVEIKYDKLWLGKTTGHVGSQAFMPVHARSGETVVGVSFTLSLPEGVTMATDEDGEPVYALNGERLNSKQFNVMAMDKGNGTWGFRISPATKAAEMNAGDSPIMTITLNIACDSQPGDYAVTLTENKLAIRTGDDLVESLEVDDGQATLTVDRMPGDVNSDGELDLSDAIMVIYYSLGVRPTLFKETAADLNGDGEIDLADAIMIIYMSLDAQEGVNGARRQADGSGGLTADDRVWLSGQDGRITMQVDNETAFVGMQCDITLPRGATLSDLQIEGNRSKGHVLEYNQTGADTYRVVVYPATANAFSGHTGSLLAFAVGGKAGTVRIGNIFFVDTQMRKHRFDDLTNETTAIGDAALSGKEGTGKERWYDLNGRRADSQPRKGIYMRSGRKIVVK